MQIIASSQSRPLVRCRKGDGAIRKTVMRHACFLRRRRERLSIRRQRPKTAMSVRDPWDSTIGMWTTSRRSSCR